MREYAGEFGTEGGVERAQRVFLEVQAVCYALAGEERSPLQRISR